MNITRSLSSFSSQLCAKRTAVRVQPEWARCSTVTFRNLSTDVSNESWAKEFKAATVDLAAMDVDTISYEESAARMRTLLKTKLLKHTDLRDNPERFFLAHRLLAEHAPILGPGFWIRFTVHYNLCVGTVLGLGTDDQIASLGPMQDEGLLGCFSLTEKLAGVSSGLVVETIADWDADKQQFVLSSPEFGARKNWISQGLVADKTVVLADLRIDGKSYGPHGFFIDLRQNGNVVEGVNHGDMGKKTVGNDLDNAWIEFKSVRVPKSSLLSRYADIENGQYVQKLKNVPVFHMIGQRLFTGRVAVAQAALEFRRNLFKSTKEYADSKECWAPKKNRLLSSVPQIRSLFEENAINQKKMDDFVAKCELELSACLRNNKMPSIELVQAIAVAKVRAVEDSIEFVHRLQNEIGSYALMKGSGFENSDFLTCCKFAEGDTRVLMQKMSRDRVKMHEKALKSGKEIKGHAEEVALCEELIEAMAQRGPQAWDEEHKKVYALAEIIIARTVEEFSRH